MSLKSLIIDDEKLSRDLLRNLLVEYCSETEVIGEAENMASALDLINNCNPDVIFLDVELQDSSGFDLLKGMAGQNHFQTVFVTAYNQYALQAIKAGAIDYILKPIGIEDLKNAVHKLCKNNNSIHQKYNLEGSWAIGSLEQNLLLPHLKGCRIVKLKDIVRIEADGNYSMVHFQNSTTFVVSKTLKELGQKLDPFWFFRPHKSHIINFYHCQGYSSDEGEHVLMSNGHHVPISRLRISDFFEALNQHTNP